MFAMKAFGKFAERLGSSAIARTRFRLCDWSAPTIYFCVLLRFSSWPHLYLSRRQASFSAELKNAIVRLFYRQRPAAAEGKGARGGAAALHLVESAIAMERLCIASGWPIAIALVDVAFARPARVDKTVRANASLTSQRSIPPSESPMSLRLSAQRSRSRVAAGGISSRDPSEDFSSPRLSHVDEHCGCSADDAGGVPRRHDAVLLMAELWRGSRVSYRGCPSASNAWRPLVTISTGDDPSSNFPVRLCGRAHRRRSASASTCICRLRNNN